MQRKKIVSKFNSSVEMKRQRKNKDFKQTKRKKKLLIKIRKDNNLHHLMNNKRKK